MRVLAGACLALLVSCSGEGTGRDDGGSVDVADAGASDAGPSDAGTSDGGVSDAGAGDAGSEVGVPSVMVVDATPNPTGLKLGFWEVYTRQAVTLGRFGRRPTSRVGFDSWDSLERSPGVYTFKTDAYEVVHAYGEGIYAAVNVSFTDTITPQKRSIPTFYPNLITDPTTRAAAKAFLRAYVQNLLTKVGSVVLTIDYEIMSNYRLYAPGSEARAAAWGAWYVEAAAVARQAAADLGKADRLRLQPIVNGDPFAEGNPIAGGPTKNAWLVDVVAASDALALDTYHSNPDKPVTDPQHTIDIIAFWVDNFAQGKDVVVTENGFTTITEQDPTITRVDRSWKLVGTEAEQAAYFRALFPALAEANRPTGVFHNQLRSFNLWAITDNTLKPVLDGDRYFGLVRDDGTDKPALAEVQAAFATLESDPLLRPMLQTEGADVLPLARHEDRWLFMNHHRRASAT